MRAILALAIPAVLLLSSCSSSGPSISNPITGGSGPRPPADVPLFGGGFRSEGDQCRRAGESAFTNQFLSDSAQLVACPPGTDPRLSPLSFKAIPEDRRTLELEAKADQERERGLAPASTPEPEKKPGSDHT